MKISTRGRYAVRVMLDLAEHAFDEYVPIREVAARQEISLKYLEQILPELKKRGLIQAAHGKGGGYKLARSPQEYKIGEILEAAEGDLAPVACLGHAAKPCPRKSVCRTRPMWEEFENMTNNFFGGITLGDLMESNLL